MRGVTEAGHRHNEATLRHLPVGCRIKFSGERLRYTIRARSERFLVCTKPFNPRRTVLYTIIDLKERVRGTENLIFCMGFETDDQCRCAIDRLEDGESEVSHRNRTEFLVEGWSAPALPPRAAP